MITHDLDLALREVVAMVPREQVFVLVDDNTLTHCLPLLQRTLFLPLSQVCTIPCGDENKTLATVEKVWQFLFDHGATRHSVLFNLGGGYVSDLGGFAASTFKRGMKYVNVPTTLLAAIDAALGGKTGFNYYGIKNGIGLFAKPERVILSLEFMKTLPAKEFLSGYAEMLKHALISSPLELNRVLGYDPGKTDLEELEFLIERSVVIKNYIVENDPTETGIRKSLNFGHTIGHALEQHSIDTGEVMPHGYAVFYGMLAEMYLSHIRLGFKKEVITQCLPLLYEYYGRPVCSCKDLQQLVLLMHHDKKNTSTHSINLTLLQAVGNCRIDQECSDTEVLEALDWLFAL